MIPEGSGICGDGLSRAYAAGVLLPPYVNIWEWVRHE